MVWSTRWKKKPYGAVWAFREENGEGEKVIQFVAAAAIGAVGVYAYSSFKKHMAALEAEEVKKAEAAKGPKIVGDLKQDPKTGRYQVKKNGKE